MFPYIPNTNLDQKKMLESIGIKSTDELFKDIPQNLQLNRRLDINKPMSELEVRRELKNLSDKNLSDEDLICFLGAGAYDHYIPSVVKHITSRSEFYTAYTPYQPEISQGTLQAIFEYQTMISELTGMEVSNASMYDGATACAEAAMISMENTKRKNIVVSKTVHPDTRKILDTYIKFHGGTIIEVDSKDGETNVEQLQTVVDKNTASVIVQNPNFFGIVENLTEVEKIVHSSKSIFIMSVDPISLGILKTPGEIGADIVVGEGQSLGNAMNFGGPYLGFMASTTKLMRKMPGRIVGQTEDVDGKRAFVLTLQAREQHIRRQKATSNICSNQSLNALAAAVYMSVMGKEGVKEVAVQCMKKSHYAYNQLIKSGTCKPVFNKPFFKEFVVETVLDSDKVSDELLQAGILGGYSLEKNYSELKNSLLFCVTEKRSKEEIDKLVNLMGVM
ncbi:aminomethyl-transferring glycine dehydrogenase subunit GcvPA [Clostridium sp. YIM B02515]|uniref:Probable glycine dehydrogenase (decarboxylating) subunit 1 n=1 Tax=Clostridium rhizosphaerae TaxID=2803861 RepID=A0ABS1TFM4_9CLOT|nr:aminomethyl-transferring glycine dehydrogenase subunit GcvPA [Clostridium rhizosphaerae]MBL4937567.1 aminomethyl-transferring glycine dehydrogenase subunit GcvPA [Clostridium rhizosphaerae]